MDNQTIVAPMTPAGVSAVAAIRVSGSRVRDVVTALFGEKQASKLVAREAKLGTARDPKTSQTIDSLLYLFFEGPNSYTGEDVLELYPHGNPLIVRELLQAIRSVEGVRLAEPGEFTRRAFLNGKMDLIQAESVADVIHSANRDELKNAHRLLAGALSQKVGKLTEQIKDISARLELDVDFAEEEADPDYSTWQVKIEGIRNSVETILKSFRGKANLSRLPLVVFYGAPNAGKSSLVNALLGEDRILVSDIAGTTRDFVEVRLFLDGGEIRLVDTAGIADKAADALDALSMEKSRQILEEADLKILLVDGSAAISQNGFATALQDEAAAVLQDDCEVHSQGGRAVYPQDDCAAVPHESHAERHCEGRSPEAIQPDMILYTKSDLLEKAGLHPSCETHGSGLVAQSYLVSAKTGYGLDALTAAMNERVFRNQDNSEDLWITSEREKVCLEEALAGIDRALDLLRTNPAVELLAFEMQLVRRALQSIVGEISSEDVLQSIFAGFCIGK